MLNLVIPNTAEFRPTGLRTAIRPDYYEWFPVLGDIELISRLNAMPFALATLLVPRNVERSLDLFPDSPHIAAAVSGLAADADGHAWQSVLENFGFRAKVIDAFASVPRAGFLPQRYRSLAWMNSYLWYSSGSCASSLGVVAFMADAVSTREIDLIVEVGYGGGYQIALFSKLFGGSRAIGYEANAPIAALGRQALLGLNKSERFELYDQPFTADLWPQSKSALVFATCGLPVEIYNEWEQHLFASQVLLAPRMLSQSDYDRMALDEGFRDLYPSFSQYTQKSDFLVLSRSEWRNGALVREDVLLDLQMVSFRAGAASEGLVPDRTAEGWLKRLASIESC
jgi:hypothetical protein